MRQVPRRHVGGLTLCPWPHGRAPQLPIFSPRRESRESPEFRGISRWALARAAEAIHRGRILVVDAFSRPQLHHQLGRDGVECVLGPEGDGLCGEPAPLIGLQPEPELVEEGMDELLPRASVGRRFGELLIIHVHGPQAPQQPAGRGLEKGQSPLEVEEGRALAEESCQRADEAELATLGVAQHDVVVRSVPLLRRDAAEGVRHIFSARFQVQQLLCFVGRRGELGLSLPQGPRSDGRHADTGEAGALDVARLCILQLGLGIVAPALLAAGLDVAEARGRRPVAGSEDLIHHTSGDWTLGNILRVLFEAGVPQITEISIPAPSTAL